jgi:hypothetical protein
MTENLNSAGGTVLEVRVPAELVKIGCVPDLQRFFDAMIYKIRRNAHKGRWVDINLDMAMEALRGEVEELDTELGFGSTVEILMEAADVANWALILANISLEQKNV